MESQKQLGPAREGRVSARVSRVAWGVSRVEVSLPGERCSDTLLHQGGIGLHLPGKKRRKRFNWGASPGIRRGRRKVMTELHTSIQ